MEYWIWLQQAIGCGNPIPEKLFDSFGGAEGVYLANPADLLIPGLNSAQKSRLCDKSLEHAKAVTEACLRLGYGIVTFGDDCYPQRLRNIYAPPCVLYVQGELGDTDNLPLIAMVGTRQVTEYGLEAATQLAIGLATHGVVVVSGLALGVDTASHKGALKGNGKTIAVIGCGLDINYPASNQELRKLIASHGAIVSEYPPGTRPTAFTFPVRNRIIAGLSLGTVVIEAGTRSGSLITASLAAEMGREVFAVPGSIFSPMSEGTNKLLRDGAKPVAGVVDILEEYIEAYPQSINMNIAQDERAPLLVQKADDCSDNGEMPMQETFEKSFAPKVPKNLTKVQTTVYQLLSREPIHVDALSLKANLEPRIVLGVLTTLEIQGLARSYPGRRFATA